MIRSCFVMLALTACAASPKPVAIPQMQPEIILPEHSAVYHRRHMTTTQLLNMLESARHSLEQAQRDVDQARQIKDPGEVAW